MLVGRLIGEILCTGGSSALNGVSNQSKHYSQTHLHKEESLFSVKGMLMALLVTAGVSDDVAEKLQMPIGQPVLENVEEHVVVQVR